MMRAAASLIRFGGLLVLAAAACRPSDRAGHGATVTVTDDAGRTVRVGVPAQRIVSAAPSLTELVFALGAGDRLVGRTTWCRYPPAAVAVPSIGDGLNPSVEAIAARQPDLVLLYKSLHTATAARQLERLGIPALVLEHDRMAHVAKTARLIGGLVGDSARGDSIAGALEALGRSAPERNVASIAFVVWDTPPIVIGAGSYLQEVATLAGAYNVFGDMTAASPTVSLEAIAQRDPDFLLAVRDTVDGTPPAWAERPEWRVIRAVREGRILVLPGALFGRPSPAAPAAVTELRRRLEAGR